MDGRCGWMEGVDEWKFFMYKVFIWCLKIFLRRFKNEILLLLKQKKLLLLKLGPIEWKVWMDGRCEVMDGRCGWMEGVDGWKV